MGDQLIGEIRIFAGSTLPTGWLPSNGQILPLVQPSPYVSLFSLLGTTYGGDGKTGFAVPNLQGREVQKKTCGTPNRFPKPVRWRVINLRALRRAKEKKATLQRNC